MPPFATNRTMRKRFASRSPGAKQRSDDRTDGPVAGELSSAKPPSGRADSSRSCPEGADSPDETSLGSRSAMVSARFALSHSFSTFARNPEVGQYDRRRYALIENYAKL